MIGELLFIFVIALIVTLLFGIGFGRRGPWGSLIAFFVILFLTVWAVSSWLIPTGPMLFGFAWIPLLIMAVVIGLLLASMYPHNYRAPKVETISEVKEEEKQLESTTRALDFFFWFLVFVLIGVIILSFVLAPPGAVEPVDQTVPGVTDPPPAAGLLSPGRDVSAGANSWMPRGRLAAEVHVPPSQHRLELLV